MTDDSLSMQLNNSAMDHFRNYTYGRNDSVDSLEIALSELDKAIELTPSHLNLYSNKTNILLSLHRIEEAIDVLNQAIEVDPNSTETLTLLGFLYESMGEESIAQEWYQKALNIYDTRIESGKFVINAKTNKAFLLFFTENEQSAKNSLEVLLQEYPNNDEVIFANEVFTDFNKQEFLNSLTYN